MTGLRKDMFDVKVFVDGVALGTFDVQTGGESDSDELTYKPGGMGAPVSLGGSVTIGQVVCSRLYDREKDTPRLHWLLGRVGKGQMVVNKQALDVNGHAFPTALVYKGVLKRVTPPEVDSNSTDAATIELEMTPQGSVPA
jgi:hypothetical protein